MTKLISKYDYETTPKHIIKKICNGCGAANGGWKNKLIPETIYGLNIKECCQIHDFMYFFGVSKYGKILADKVFLTNMYRLIADGNYWLRFLRRRRAKKYYLAVKFFGKKAYMSNKEGFNNNIPITSNDLVEQKKYEKLKWPKLSNETIL